MKAPWFKCNEYGVSIRLMPFAIWLHFSTRPTWASCGKNADGSLRFYCRGRAFRFGWTYSNDYAANSSLVLGDEFSNN